MSTLRNTFQLLSSILLVWMSLGLAAGILAKQSQAEASPSYVATDALGDPLPEGAVLRLGTTRLLQSRGVLSLAFSPDSKVVVAVGYDEAIRAWEVATGKELPPFTREEHAAWCAVFLPDGKTLAAGYSEDIVLWDVAQRQPIRRIEDKKGLSGASLLRVSPNGEMLVALSGRQTLRLWGVSSGKLRGELHGVEHEVLSLAFSPDSRAVVACTGLTLGVVDYPHYVSLWEMPKAQPKWRTKLLGVDSAVFFPDGKTLAVGALKGPIRYLDAETGRERQATKMEGRRIIVSADGKLLAVARPGRIVHLCDAVTGLELHSLRGHGSPVLQLAFSPDGKVLATGDQDGTVVLWNTATGRELHPMPGHRYRAGGVAFLPDGRSLASRGGDQTVRVWDLTSGKESLCLDVGAQQEGVREFIDDTTDLAASLACSPDGKLLATWGPNRSVLVLETRTGKQRFALTGHDHRLTSLAFAPDGKTLASCDASGTVKLWDATEGKLARVLTNLPPGGRVGADWLVQFSPDSKRLAAHSRGTVAVWDLAEGSQLWSERHKATSLLFCHSGELLTAVEPGSGKEPNTIRLIEVTSGEVVRSLTWPTRNRGSGAGRLSLAVSPDGRYLASADGRSLTSANDADWDVRVWDLLAGRQVRQFLGHRGPINGVVFSPDSKRLASASDDGTILVWDFQALPKASEELLRKGLDAATLDRLWSDLGNADPQRSFPAMILLAHRPDRAIPLIRDRLKPVSSATHKGVPRLIAELDDAEFTVREAASEALKARGATVEPDLQRAFVKATSAEVRRLREVLDHCAATPPAPDILRQDRATTLLEWIGSTEARTILRHLSQGVPAAYPTHQAASALERLERRADGR